MNDHEQMKSLTAEMDDLNDRQTAMNKRRQRIVQAITKYRKGGAQSSLPAGCTTKQSPRHSPLQGQLSMKSGNSSSKHNSGCYGHSEESSPSNPLNTLYMAAVGNHKDSLFEEGLRIATQYGMSDFAQELIGMKSTKEEVEDKDCGLGVSTVNSVLTSSGESVTSSSSFAVAVNGQFMQLLPSSLSSSTLGSDIGVIHTSRSPTHSTTGAHANVLSADNKNYHPHSSKIMASSLTCVPSVVSNDESVDDTHIDEMFTVSNSKTSCGKQIPTTAGESSVSSQDSTATTTTTKSSHFLEVETRRSSRRKNGEPDYYLINGGEKRFRSGNVRRSSSTSSEQARRLSSSSSPLAPGTLAATSPTKNYKLVHQTNEDEDTQTDISDLRSKSRVKVNKMTVETNQLGDDIYDTETNT
uniref:Uncharacterized protein n=1 Tax=Arion vulgaris TaxID=1028688 RepID=A0A0B6ZMD7_9EUPU